MRLTRNICFLLIVLTLLSCNKKKPLEDAGPPATVYPTICEFPSWSPDGSTIAYWYSGIIYVRSNGHFDLDPSLQGIWFISPDGTNKQMLLQGGDLPDWSPDGQKLAFTAGAQIYTMKINGDSLTQLTFEGRNFFPDWSPDGKKIAFSSMHYSSPMIYVMDSDGKNLKNLTPEGGDMPAWSPDGSKIAYMSNFGKEYTSKHGQIWIMDADGSNKRQLTFDGWEIKE